MDAYERLGLKRVLALNAEKLEVRYRELSKKCHPDAGGSAEEFELLQRDYELLKKPSARLKQFLKKTDSRGKIPEEVMSLFTPMAECLQAVEGFLTERSSARSRLGKAMMDAKVPALKARVEELGGELSALEERLVSLFPEFDERGLEHCQEEMEEVARGLSFVEKWQDQIRATTGRLFQAMLG